MCATAAIQRDDDPPSKQALLASALRLFVANGICETTIRDVAADAGFSNPALFKFFRSRDELAICVFERCYERLATMMFDATAEGSFETKLRKLVAAVTEMIDRDRDAFLYVTEQLRRFWPRAAPHTKRLSIVRRLETVFALGVTEGRVSADHDVRLLVAATIGTLSQFARAVYFAELPVPASRWAPELERMIGRIAW
jgi:AcrR family transcriptional regulator